eukprot:2074296-Rhodomonas_salina.1
MITKAYGNKSGQYVDCKIVEPVKWAGRKVQLAISEPKLTKKQLAAGMGDDYFWWLRKLLDTNFHEPTTLED